jgi:CubicO group peptidase (beta-lactamase class C family)
MTLEAYRAEQSRQGQLQGAVLVRRAGKTLLDQGYGAADRAHGRPNTPETAFQLASISKQFTAAAILLLQEWGALSVQDRISRWLPVCPDTWEPITVHQLLTHTSGIGHWQDLPELDLFKPLSWEHLLGLFQQLPLKFTPGHNWAYSSPAYVLLAHIVEQVAGEPYAHFLQQRIFQPLGMASTGAGNRAPRLEQQAQGYAGEAGEEAPAPSFELDTVGMGAGDIWATTRDLVRWNAALAAPGLLSAKSLEMMFAPHAMVPDEVVRDAAFELSSVQYGYGWFIGEVQGHRLWFHPGENAGFHAIALQAPDDGMIVIVLLNEETNPFEIGLYLVRQVLGS